MKKKRTTELTFNCGRHCVGTCPSIEDKCIFFGDIAFNVNSRTVKLDVEVKDKDGVKVITDEFMPGTVTEISADIIRVQLQGARYPMTVNTKTGQLTYDSDDAKLVDRFIQLYPAGAIIANAQRNGLSYQTTANSNGYPVVVVEALGGKKLVLDTENATLDAQNFTDETCKLKIEEILRNTGLKVTNEQIKHEVNREISIDLR